MDKGLAQTFFQRRHTNNQQVNEKVLNITNHQGNANQNHNITSHLLRCLLASKNPRDNRCWPGCGEREPLYTIGGTINWYSCYRKHYEGPQKVKNRTAISSSNLTSGCVSKGNKTTISKRYLHSHVHHSIIHNS